VSFHYKILCYKELKNQASEWISLHTSQNVSKLFNYSAMFLIVLCRPPCYMRSMLHKESIITFCICDTYTWKRPSVFIRNKPILSSERLLHKDYDRKGSVAKIISGREPQRAWRKDELTGGKPSVVKWLTVSDLFRAIWRRLVRLGSPSNIHS
jgi:hypothetical protein